MSSASLHFLSSGDLRIDRRYRLALDLAARGEPAAAADLLAQTVQDAPHFVAAWFALGDLWERLGDTQRAIEAFRRARECDAEDRHGAGLRLARLGGLEIGAAMTRGYVRAVFDQYAPDFDRALLSGLAYCGPQALHEAVLAACAAAERAPHFRRVVDLGCGTGLAGEAFRAHATALVGVDLSPRMIAMAQRKGCYDDLHVADMLDFLREQADAGCDLVLAADAFVYVADLAPIFREIARVLESGGLVAFTVERHEGEGVTLGAKLRYAHAESHVRALLAAAGLARAECRPLSVRREGGAPVPGLVVTAARR